ncbi:MAG TPA: c-type cytochrome biogenesis protein CcmI [Pseudolabrys sp.]|nr:c-type cytochrome biogenesis protein CcmI [Pseudolabrys sp.]
MTLWLLFVLMTAVAAFAVLWPLARNTPVRSGGDLAVYRDQLDEIQRDRATGLIGEAEAEAARVEVSRRLIAAADAADQEQPAADKSSLLHRRVTAIAGLILLPAGALALYLTIGSPDLPGEPLAARMQAPKDTNDIQTMVAEVENHVARDPNDGKGWEVLAPVYMRLGRYDDAARAWHNAISLNGSNAEREADYGEAVVASANGVVTDEAKAAFDRALKIDPQNVMALFYKGMAADQDGRRAEAEKIWNDLIAGAPPNAPWIEVVKHALARNAPAGAQPAAAQGAPADHDVNAMVERLAERLHKDGSDVNGWLQLVRSYRVLGQNDKMEAALADARKALAGDPDKLKLFNDGAVAAAAAAPAAAVPPPAAPQVAAAPLQQDQSIVAMVQRLADRLKKDGSDVNGWLQLVRSYRVLEQQDKMQAAITDARKALAGDPDKLRQFDAGAEAAASASAAPPPMAAPAPVAPPAGMPGPSAADMQAAAKMSSDQQNQMIRGMVAKLADKLKTDGSDLAGWERLLRAYIVLGERDKAHAAAADARKALASDPDKLRQIDEVIKDLKVEG